MVGVLSESSLVYVFAALSVPAKKHSFNGSPTPSQKESRMEMALS
jgi:hypothetical protein